MATELFLQKKLHIHRHYFTSTVVRTVIRIGVLQYNPKIRSHLYAIVLIGYKFIHLGDELNDLLLV